MGRYPGHMFLVTHTRLATSYTYQNRRNKFVDFYVPSVSILLIRRLYKTSNTTKTYNFR